MLLKEPNQPMSPLRLRLFQLELPFRLPEPFLQFFLFPDQFVDPGIPFRYLLLPDYLGQCGVYILDGDVTQGFAYVYHHVPKLIILDLSQFHPLDRVLEGVCHFRQLLLGEILLPVPVSVVLGRSGSIFLLSFVMLGGRAWYRI